LNAYPRVAFLPDTFSEINGVAHTARHLEAFARRRQVPLLSVHCSKKTGKTTDGVVSILELQRSPACIGLDANLDYDVLLWRYVCTLAKHVRGFGAQIIHVTGPGDLGSLGLLVAGLLRLPIVISWHTNLHEYAATRLRNLLRFLGKDVTKKAGHLAGNLSLEILRHFYRRATATLAPNQELVEYTHSLSRRPCYLMRRGVDTQLFNPTRRNRVNKAFRIGYVGRLTPEKNVRFLITLAAALREKCRRRFEFVIVGEGSEERSLRAQLPDAHLTGVLRGETLAQAYADLDLFVFPSETDTFGNVILEALASGVPAVVTNQGGPKFLIEPGVTGYVAADQSEFIDFVDRLLTQPVLHAQMRQAAVQFALKQSWDNVFESVWRVYGEAIESHARASRWHWPSLVSSRVHGRSSS